MPLETAQFLTSLQVPEADRIIIKAGNGSASVRTKRHDADPPTQRAPEDAVFPILGYVPAPHRTVAAAGEYPRAVQRERDTRNAPCVSGEAANLFSGPRVPNRDGIVLTVGNCYQPPIRGHGNLLCILLADAVQLLT